MFLMIFHCCNMSLNAICIPAWILADTQNTEIGSIQSSLSFSSAQSFVKEKPVEGGEVCKLAMDAKSHTPVSLATLHWPVLQALLSGSLQGKIGYVSS